MFCTKCGNSINKNDNFCGKCGLKVKEDSANKINPEHNKYSQFDNPTQWDGYNVGKPKDNKDSKYSQFEDRAGSQFGDK